MRLPNPPRYHWDYIGDESARKNLRQALNLTMPSFIETKVVGIIENESGEFEYKIDFCLPDIGKGQVNESCWLEIQSRLVGKPIIIQLFPDAKGAVIYEPTPSGQYQWTGNLDLSYMGPDKTFWCNQALTHFFKKPVCSSWLGSIHDKKKVLKITALACGRAQEAKAWRDIAKGAGTTCEITGIDIDQDSLQFAIKENLLVEKRAFRQDGLLYLKKPQPNLDLLVMHHPEPYGEAAKKKFKAILTLAQSFKKPIVMTCYNSDELEVMLSSSKLSHRASASESKLDESGWHIFENASAPKFPGAERCKLNIGPHRFVAIFIPE